MFKETQGKMNTTAGLERPSAIRLASNNICIQTMCNLTSLCFAGKTGNKAVFAFLPKKRVYTILTRLKVNIWYNHLYL